jgi:hypothetical protein
VEVVVEVEGRKSARRAAIAISWCYPVVNEIERNPIISVNSFNLGDGDPV